MKEDILRKFTKFTGKHLCQSLFFNKSGGLRPATLFKRKLLHSCFPVNFAKYSRTPFLQSTSGQLLLCFIEFSDWELLPQNFKNSCCWKIGCGKHDRLRNNFIKFPRTSSGTAKTIAKFKETTNCKIPHAVSLIRAPATDFSSSHAFLTIH